MSEKCFKGFRLALAGSYPSSVARDEVEDINDKVQKEVDAVIKWVKYKYLLQGCF